MRRLLRTRRWLGGLAFAVAAAAICVALGRWQWDKSQSSGGDLQNFAYAFNWWLFAVLCVGIWVKALRDEARRDPSAAAPPTRQAPARSAIATAELDPQDTELAEWNAWLAELNAHPHR